MSMCVCVCIPQLVDTQVAGAFTAGEKKAEWHLALCSWNRPVMANVTPTTLPHTNKQVFLIAPTHTAAMYFQIPWTQSLWECCFSPSGKLHWPLPLCTCLWGFICMQSYQMGAEVLAGWPAHTRRDTHIHTHTVCSCISSLICCLLSLFPSREQEPFSQSWMWSSFSKTNLSFSPCSPPPQLFSPQTGTRLFWAFFPIHTGYKCKLMLILMSNQKLQKKKKLNWKCQGTFTAARGRLWCKTVEPLSSFE